MFHTLMDLSELIIGDKCLFIIVKGNPSSMVMVLDSSEDRVCNVDGRGTRLRLSRIFNS